MRDAVRRIGRCAMQPEVRGQPRHIDFALVHDSPLRMPVDAVTKRRKILIGLCGRKKPGVDR